MSTNQPNVNPAQPNVSPGPPTPTLSSADHDAIMAMIATIRQRLFPFLIDLTPAARKGLAQLADKSHAFVTKAVDVATQNPAVIPGSHSLEDVRNTAELFQRMAAIRLALEQLYKQVHDINYVRLKKRLLQKADQVRAVGRTQRHADNLIESDHRQVKQRLRPMQGTAHVAYRAPIDSGH